MVQLSIAFLVSAAASALAVPATPSKPITSTAPAAIPTPTIDEVRAAFHSAGIVPDVLPSFSPRALFYMTYTGNLSDGSSSKVALPGTAFAKDDTLLAPQFSVQGLALGSYVIAIVDPDAPSRDSPSISQIRHMLAVDMKVTKVRSKAIRNSFVLSNTTAAVNDYLPPTPPAGSGPHRYVALLYAQPREFDISFLDVSGISKFNISSFAERAKLGEPLAGTFMTVEVP